MITRQLNCVSKRKIDLFIYFWGGGELKFIVDLALFVSIRVHSFVFMEYIEMYCSCPSKIIGK